MVGHRILDIETGASTTCTQGKTILQAMEVLGAKGVPIGCRGGGCGVCKIRIVSGEYSRKAMSKAHVSKSEEAEGITLACRSFPESDIEISIIGKIRNFSDRQFHNKKQ